MGEKRQNMCARGKPWRRVGPVSSCPPGGAKGEWEKNNVEGSRGWSKREKKTSPPLGDQALQGERLEQGE